MLIIELELVLIGVILLIALCRRAVITKWLARRRYEISARRARRLFRHINESGGQDAVYDHLMREGAIIRAKRRVGSFYMVSRSFNNERQDVLLRMSDKNEPRWVAMSELYDRAIQDKIYTDNHRELPNIWSSEFDRAYQHWCDNTKTLNYTSST